jgi:hypothetical protein
MVFAPGYVQTVQDAIDTGTIVKRDQAGPV